MSPVSSSILGVDPADVAAAAPVLAHIVSLAS